MSEEPRDPPRPAFTWTWWEALVVIAIGIVLGGLLAAPFAREDPTPVQEIVGGMLVELSWAGAVLMWLGWRHRRSMAALGAVPRDPGRDLAVGAGTGVLLVLTCSIGVALLLQALLEALTNVRDVTTPEQLPEDLAGVSLALSAFFVVLVAPFCEELLFRGMLYGGLRSSLPALPAALISSAIFGAFHLPAAADDPWQSAVLIAVTLACVGFGLALLYERRRSLFANVVAHGTFNLIGFVLIVSSR